MGGLLDENAGQEIRMGICPENIKSSIQIHLGDLSLSLAILSNPYNLVSRIGASKYLTIPEKL
jgi:hypothetical protein